MKYLPCDFAMAQCPLPNCDSGALYHIINPLLNRQTGTPLNQRAHCSCKAGPTAASGRFHLPGFALALMRVEEALADADRLRRHFDQLVVLDVGNGLLQRHPARRRQADAFVLARSAEVGELLGLEGIDLKVLRLRILADDHAL